MRVTTNALWLQCSMHNVHVSLIIALGKMKEFFFYHFVSRRRLHQAYYTTGLLSKRARSFRPGSLPSIVGVMMLVKRYVLACMLPFLCTVHTYFIWQYSDNMYNIHIMYILCTSMFPNEQFRSEFCQITKSYVQVVHYGLRLWVQNMVSFCKCPFLGNSEYWTL